jgi:PAS domain S-box-containing protein
MAEIQKPERKQNNLILGLAVLVILVSLGVMAGWILDIGALKSILPQWVTMKFSTALSFFLSGITLYFIAKSCEENSPAAQVVLPVATLGIFLLMATFLAATFLQVRTGIEDLFVREAPGAVKTIDPGRPSIGTMVCFLLIAAAGIMAMLDFSNLKSKLILIGVTVCGIGGLAISGYVFHQPLLYFTVERWSTAMALHTAILFVILGIGLVLLRKEKEKKRRFLSIQRKIILIFLAISIMPMSFVGILIYSNARDSLGETNLERLRTLAEFKEAEIYLFMDILETRTKGLASDGLLVNTLKDAMGEGKDGKALLEGLDEYLARIEQLDEKILTINVLDPMGKVVASSQAEMVGLDKSGAHYFQKGKEKVFMKDMHFESRDAVEIDIAAPIRNPHAPLTTLGVLVVHYDASLLNKLISGEMVLEMGALTQAKGIGTTGETYLVNSEKLMITDSLFVQDAPFNQSVDTLPVKKCIEGNEEVKGQWMDYRGVPVIGASMCMKFGGIHWTLVSEQDEAEVFVEMNKLRNVAIFIILLSMVMIFLVAISIAKSISRPIQALQKGTEIVGNGNLDHKVGIPETDEIGRLSNAFDLMAQKLKTTMGRLGSVMQMAPVGIAISSINGDEGATEVNFALLKILGYNSREDFSGLPVSAFFADPATRKELNELREKGVVTDFETELKRKDGSLFPASISSLSFTEEDGKRQALSIVQDISERKRTEEDLLRLKEEAEKANRLKSDFLANVSHELRTPLTAIIGFPVIVLEYMKKYPDLNMQDIEKIIKCNQIISNQCKKLLALIDDLIDLTRFETEDFDLKESPILAHALIVSAISVFQSIAKKKGLTLVDNRLEQGDFYFMGDIKRLEQILFKLLDNAVKFSEKGTIRLSAFPQGESIIFQVRDDGAGLTEDEATLVFERFHQIDGSSTRRHGGLGLGLDLVKKLTRKMNGEISVESIKGMGSTFTVRLPWVRIEEKGHGREAAMNAVIGKKILLVEDDENIRILAEMTLPENKFVFAENGARAMEILESKRDFDMILLDRLMPVMDGVQFMKEFAAKYRGLNIPIVMLTAAVMQEDVGSAIKLAAELQLNFQYAIKPFTRQSIIAALDKLEK